MKHIEDVQRAALRGAYNDYVQRQADVRNNIGRYHCAQVLGERAEKYFKGCHVYNHPDFTYGSITIYLQKPFNLSEHVNIFLDENSELIELLGGGEPKVKHYQDQQSMDYVYPKYRIDVYYGGGACKRVKVGSVQKTVTEDKYEIVCE